MVFLETLGLFVAAVLLACACGYGVVTLLLPEELQGEYRAILMAPVGYAVYSWFAFTLSGTFHLAGRSATAVAGAVFLLVTLFAVWRRRWRVGSRRGVARVVGLSSAATLFILWPLFVVGADTFVGAVNPDFTATLYDLHFLQAHPLDAEVDRSLPTDGYYDTVTGTLGKSARFGCSYFVLLVQAVLRVPMRTALTLSIAVFVFCIPLSAYFFARAGVGLSPRAAAWAAIFMGTSTATAMSYVYFYVGQNSGLGVLPTALTLLYLVFRIPSWRLCVLAALVLNGLYSTYTGMFLYAVAPVGVAAAYVATRSKGQFRGTLLRVGAIIGGTLILNAGNYGFLARAFAGWNNIVLQTLQGQFFLDFLTEEFVPIFLGLVSYPSSASIHADWLDQAGPWRLYGWSAVLVVALLGAAVHWARTSDDRGAAVLGWAAASIYGAVWYVFTFEQEYGYAVFKMSSWLQFLYAVCLAYGLEASLARAQHRGPVKVRIVAAAALAVFGTAFAANVLSTCHLMRLSLGRDTHRGMIVNVYDMSGNREFLDLPRKVESFVKPTERIGVRLTDSIQNEWAAYYLKAFKTSLLGHHLIPADDENLPDVVTRMVTDYYGTPSPDENPYFHGNRDDYYLTWNDGFVNRDIVEQDLPRPLWESRTFRFIKASDTRDLIFTGRGWYRLEFRHLWDWWWPSRFRWTAQGGEVYLVRPSKAGEPYRLSFVGIVGHGRASDRRVIELWHNATCFDEIEIRSAARVVSRPFYPGGEVDRLVIRVREPVRELGRRVTLWNADVPGDYRKLNLLVSEVRLLPPGPPSVIAPAARRLSGEALFAASPRFNGLQPNGWVAGGVSLTLPRPRDSRRVTLSLFVPSHPRLRFPLTMVGSVDGRPFSVEIARPGPFQPAVPLGAAAADGTVTIEAGVGLEYAVETADMENHPIFESFRLEAVAFE